MFCSFANSENKKWNSFMLVDVHTRKNVQKSRIFNCLTTQIVLFYTYNLCTRWDLHADKKWPRGERFGPICIISWIFFCSFINFFLMLTWNWVLKMVIAYWFKIRQYSLKTWNRRILWIQGRTWKNSYKTPVLIKKYQPGFLGFDFPSFTGL